MNKFVCNTCGYILETDLEYEEIPEDYVCPLCGVSIEDFSSIDS